MDNNKKDEKRLDKKHYVWHQSNGKKNKRLGIEIKTGRSLYIFDEEPNRYIHATFFEKWNYIIRHKIQSFLSSWASIPINTKAIIVIGIITIIINIIGWIYLAYIK